MKHLSQFIAGGFQGGEAKIGKERLKEEDVSLAPVVVFQHIQAQAEGVAQEDVAHMHEQHENDSVQERGGIPCQG